MFDITILNREETEKVLKMREVIPVVEDVYRLKAQGDTTVFPLIFHEFNPGVADMDIKSGCLKQSEIFGLKVVSWFGENPEKGIQALIGTIMIFDSTTGAPVGILDGTHITGMRTGAAGAIGAKYLARKESRNLLIVGAGHIATFQIAASVLLLHEIDNIMIFDPLNQSNAQKMASSIKNTLQEEFGIKANDNIIFTAVYDIKEATGKSDVIITVTPSKTPIIKKEWVKPGTHFSCIGADMSGKEEIDPAIFGDAKVFVDDIQQCINVGEIEMPVQLGILKREDIAGEIGEIITGAKQGRDDDKQITVFDATGTALLDLLTGKLALAAAAKANIGTNIKF